MIFPVVVLLVLVGLNALVVGAGLVVQPDGVWIGLTVDWLAGSPFSDFQIPGFCLFLFVGLLPLITCIALIAMPSWRIAERLNIYHDQYWGWTYSLYSGIVMLIWIIAQQLMTKYFVLQPIIALAAVLILIFTLLPRVRNHYRT
jgi:hypothetical protein